MPTVFTGSCVALVTPFDEKGVNFGALEELLDFQLKNGTDAILVCGTTGEPSTMTHEEEREVIRFAVEKVAGRVPVIAGTGSNSTAEAIAYSQAAEKLGVDALLAVTPYYNKTTQRGLIAHYTAIANSTALPLILYNVPGRTGLNLLPATVGRLAEHPRIQALKEASGNMAQMIETAALTRGMDFDIYSGEDALNAPILAMGGKGVISVVANVAPREISNLARAALAGDIAGAAAVQLELTDLAKALFVEVNPIPVKVALNLMGKNAGLLRPPLTADMEEANLQTLTQVLKKHKLI